MIETETGRSHVRTAIVDAADRLLREHGAAAVTTRAVAEGAGVQAPTIYRLFGDKDGLLDAVAEHAMATFASAKAAAAVAAAGDVDPVDPVDDLCAGWRTYVEFGLANPALHVLLSDPVRARRSPATQAGREVLAARVHRIASAGRLRVPEQRAVDLVHAAGSGVVLTLLATPPELRDPTLANDMLTAVLTHLVTDSPAPPDSGAVPAAVALRAVAPALDGLTPAERTLLADWLDRVVDAARLPTDVPGAHNRRYVDR